MKKLVGGALVCALAAFVGCKGKSADKSPAPGKDEPKGAAALPAPTPHVDTTSRLWAYAPADAAVGFVLGDGVGERLRDVGKSVFEQLASRPMGAEMVKAMAEARKELGFDPFDAAGWKTIGVDISKGAAMFVSPRDGAEPVPLLILPIVDRAAFRAKTKGKVETIDGREVDRHDDDMICLPGEVYACGKTLADIDAGVKPHDSKLAGTIKALPARRRGDFEAWGDLTAFPEIKDDMAEMAMFGRVDNAGMVVRMEPDGMNMNLWAGGDFNGPIGKAVRSEKPSAEIAGLTGKSATVTRFKVPMALLLTQAPPSLPLAGVDARKDLLDQLSGEVLVTTTGKGLLAGGIVFGVLDAGKVGPVVKAACEELKKLAPASGGILANLTVNDAGCVGELSFDGVAKLYLPSLPFALALEGKTLALWLGGTDHKLAAGDASKDAMSVEARDMLAGPTTAVFWTRSYDFDFEGVLELVPADKRAEVRKQLGPALDGITWVASSLAEVAMAVTIGETDSEVAYRLVTFAADPAEAQTMWKTAHEKRQGGDRAAWTAGITELAKKYPDSRAGKRAQLELDGSPLLGPFMGLAVGGGAAYFMTLSSAMGGDSDKPFGGLLEAVGEEASQGTFEKKEDGVAGDPPAEKPPAEPAEPAPAPATP
jgi:hypothetical protein